MRQTPPSPTACRPFAETSSPAFRVVAIHDGFSAGIRAQEALEWLKYILSPELEVYAKVWSFEHLKRLEFYAITIHTAAEAHVLIVCASGGKPLPAHIRQWLDFSLAEPPPAHPVLVALHDGKHEAGCMRGPLCTHLKGIADFWHADFMCNDDFDQRLDRHYANELIQSRSSQRWDWPDRLATPISRTPAEVV